MTDPIQLEMFPSTMEEGKTYRAVSPQGDEILGTYEMCPARSEISYFIKGPTDNPVMYEHSGETEMFWDVQETQTKDGKTVFLCSNGMEWTEDELRFIEIDERGNDVTYSDE